jgi:hypothetical protein
LTGSYRQDHRDKRSQIEGGKVFGARANPLALCRLLCGPLSVLFGAALGDDPLLLVLADL